MVSVQRIIAAYISGLLFFGATIFAEYLYPVGSFPQASSLFLIYQKTPLQLELLLWNTSTHEIQPELLSRFTPANFALIPDGSGYSFIDNGIIRIKRFIKRSPQSLELDKPIYDFTTLHWIDADRCYLSARYKNNYGLFELSSEGDVTIVLRDAGVDYLYPQKIDDELFYIERTVDNENNSYQLKSMPYPNGLSHDTATPHKSDDSTSNDIYDFTTQAVAFLNMQSKTEGYVLEYPVEITKKTTELPFVYTRIHKEGDEWKAERLFSFSIPISLLFSTSPDRLYESIVPLLPKKIDGAIYFATTVHNQTVGIFKYNESTRTITAITHAQSEHTQYFVPFKDKEQLWMGGSVATKGIEYKDISVIKFYEDDHAEYVDMAQVVD